MKENKYDDEAFFEAYAKMPRSEQGLAAAGEWPILRSLLGDVKGKTVLDLGCGYGWHSKFAIEQGAKRVVGVDLSEKMIARAKEISSDLTIDYRICGIEDFEAEAAEFDVVLSSLALHYVADLDVVATNVFNWLRPGGRFVFSIEHPVFTAADGQDWHYDAEGRRLHWPVDRYFEKGPRTTSFLGHEVAKYHRSLSSLLSALTKAGFAIETLEEPFPSDEVLTRYPDWADEVRRPLMLLVASEKRVD